jgi:hypothetical protein
MGEVGLIFPIKSTFLIKMRFPIKEAFPSVTMVTTRVAVSFQWINHPFDPKIKRWFIIVMPLPCPRFRVGLSGAHQEENSACRLCCVACSSFPPLLVACMSSRKGKPSAGP